tara:strand:- start:455 stop:1792 length:1338 start_codon:yes stop_codon:yes gene_type:complete
MVNFLLERKNHNNLEWVNTKEDIRERKSMIRHISPDFFSPVDNVFSPQQSFVDAGIEIDFMYLDEIDDPSNLNLIYFIHLDRFGHLKDNCHRLWAGISEKVKQWSDQNLCKIVFWFCDEGYSLTNGEWFHALCNECSGLDIEKVWLVNGDHYACRNQRYLVQKQYPDTKLMQAYSLPLFDHAAKKMMIVPEDVVPTKKLVSLNARDELHRRFMYEAIEPHIDDCIFSYWFRYGRMDYVDTFWRFAWHWGATDKEAHSLAKYSDYDPIRYKLKSRINSDGQKVFEDIRPSQKDPKMMDIDSANKVRLDEQSMAAVHTLAETIFAPADGWAPEHGPRFITEKSYKPMVVRRPFVIMGHHRILQDLRADGYETFPELWDESYDTIENPLDRARAVQKVIRELLSKDQQTLNNMVASVKDKLDHNFNTLQKVSLRNRMEKCLKTLWKSS